MPRPKTYCGWVIPSDRKLVHWACILDWNPDVVFFDIATQQIIPPDHVKPRAIELNAIAQNKTGHIGWHEVKVGTLKCLNTVPVITDECVGASFLLVIGRLRSSRLFPFLKSGYTIISEFSPAVCQYL